MLGSSSGLLGSSSDGGAASGGGGGNDGGGGGEVVGTSSGAPRSTIMGGIAGTEDERAMIRVDEGFMGERGSGGNRWPRQETLALLKIRSDMDVAFRDSSLKGPLWEDVSRKMAELGFHRSSKKCKEKFENVYKYHKRTKDGRVGKSDGKTYRFFEQLEALENHPSNLPPLHPPSSATRSSFHQQPAQEAVPVTMIMPAGSITHHHHHHHNNSSSSNNNNNNNNAVIPPVSIPSPQLITNNSTATATVPSSTAPVSITVSHSPTSATTPTTNPTINPQTLQPQLPHPVQQPPATTVLPSTPYHNPHQHHHHPQQHSHHPNLNPLPSSSPSCTPSSSSSTSSDEEILGRRKRKRKWKGFFERLMKEVIDKQEELQRKFLDAIEKREHERMVRDEAWKMQETNRLKREHEMLVQERSTAAAKDAALISFLQKISEQQQIPFVNPMPVVQQQPRQEGLPAAGAATTAVPTLLTPTAAAAKTSAAMISGGGGQVAVAQAQGQMQQQASINPAPAAVPITQLPNLLQQQVPPPTVITAAPTINIVSDLPMTTTATPPQPTRSNINDNNGDSGGGISSTYVGTSSSRWPKAEVQALINLRTKLDQKYQESGPKGPLWEEISASMRKIGYNRNAKRCKEKWENINKYFKKVKESNKKRPEDSKTCPYFHQLDALYKEKTTATSPTSTTKVDHHQNTFSHNGNNNSDTNNPAAVGYNQPPGSIVPGGGAAPIMAQPEQQWPLLPPQAQHQQPPEARMEDPGSDNNQDDDDGDDDYDDDEEDDQGGGYEIVANTGAAAGGGPNTTAAMDNS